MMRMPSLPRLATLFVAITALSWALPELFSRATQPERVRVSAYYSAITDGFVIRTDSPQRSGFADESGAALDAAAARRRLPFLYFADLAKHGLFPDRVAGQAVTVDQARRELQVLRLSSRDWTLPAIPLLPLFESAPWGTRLALPDDMVRPLAAGLDFVRAADGAVLADKSARFTAALTKAGFAWPARGMGGNPSPLKEFDEGLILVDAGGRPFQLKMVEGQPWVRAFDLTVPGTLLAVAVEEHPRRDILASLVTDGGIWLLTYGSTLVRLPAPGFAADSVMVGLRTDPLHRTITVTDPRAPAEDPARVVVTGPDYQPIRNFQTALPADYRARLETLRDLESLLTPVALIQSVPDLGRLTWRLVPASNLGLAALAALVSTVALWGWRRRFGPRPADAVELILTLVCCVPALLALVVFGPPAPPRR